MSELLNIIKDFKNTCPCGKVHETAIKDIRIFSGAVHSVGEILKENGFSKNFCLLPIKTH